MADETLLVGLYRKILGIHEYPFDSPKERFSPEMPFLSKLKPLSQSPKYSHVVVAARIRQALFHSHRRHF